MEHSLAPPLTALERAAAVRRLFVEHIPALRRMIHMFCGDPGLCDEIVQETYLVVDRKSEDYQFGTNFLAWISSIARFKLLEQQRLQQLQVFSQATIEALASSPASRESDEQMDRLDECVEVLPRRMRQVLMWRYWEDIRPSEIARRLRWTDASVHVALSRARGAVRECLGKKRLSAGLEQ